MSCITFYHNQYGLLLQGNRILFQINAKNYQETMYTVVSYRI